MSHSETMDLLNKYYRGLLSKGDWHSMLADDILLTGTVAKESREKDAFVNNNFFKMIKTLKVKQMIVEDGNACVVVVYDLLSPKGKSFSSEVAEIWKVKDGQLSSLAIYFDTAVFQNALA